MFTPFASFGILTLLWVATAAQPSNRTPTVPTKSEGSESIGGQLLDGLGSGAVEPASQTPLSGPGARSAQQLESTKLSLSPARFDDLGDDLGAPSGPLPLVRARQGMEQAESLLTRPGAVAEARQAQREVVDQLDELIAQLSKQCQVGGVPSGQPGSLPGQRSQASVGAAADQAGSAAEMRRELTDPFRHAGTAATELAEREELLKKLWGHLPLRSREQMLQSFSPEFLPMYELELEKYYRRLAEEQDAKRN